MENEENTTKPLISNRLYDFIKRLVQVVLPAAGSAYFGLAQIYGWGNAEQVLGTITILTTFLGVCLGISTVQYNKSDAPYDGTLNIVQRAEGPKLFSMEVDVDPNEIEGNRNFNLRVRSVDESEYEAEG